MPAQFRWAYHHSTSVPYTSPARSQQIARSDVPSVLSGAGDGLDGIYFDKAKTHPYAALYQTTSTQPSERETVAGTVRTYDIVVDDSVVLSRVAWEVMMPAPGYEVLAGYMGLRIRYQGDSGFEALPEVQSWRGGDGMALDEAWFG